VTDTIKGTYVGPIQYMKGKTALIRFTDDGVLAQFDDVGLTLMTKHLGSGWHTFARTDFAMTNMRTGSDVF
jgi:hypothetical protein